jgi:hypothetical protein
MNIILFIHNLKFSCHLISKPHNRVVLCASVGVRLLPRPQNCRAADVQGRPETATVMRLHRLGAAHWKDLSKATGVGLP